VYAHRLDVNMHLDRRDRFKFGIVCCTATHSSENCGHAMQSAAWRDTSSAVGPIATHFTTHCPQEVQLMSFGQACAS